MNTIRNTTSGKVKGLMQYLIRFLSGVALVLISSPGHSTPETYGIRNQAAPPLTARYWVDADGKPGKSVDLAALKGRVVYLLFFQDW